MICRLTTRARVRLAGLALAAVVIESSPFTLEAEAQEYTWVGSIRLRGGFDTNPILSSPAAGSAFAGFDAALAGGAAAEDYTIGLVGELGVTRHADNDIPLSQHAFLELTLADRDSDFWSLRSTTSVGDDRDYETRLFSAAEALRVQWIGGPIRPFLTIEGGYSRLNETNAILGDFLPKPHRTLRGTIIPGIALRFDNFEIGSSVNLTGVRYAEEFDDFGFRRDNERLQPFLFSSYEWNGLSISAAVSRLFGYWHDPDFSDVSETLYDVTIQYESGPMSLELSVSRSARETTFPISPIAVDRIFLGRIGWTVDSNVRIGGYGSHKKTEYLNFPLYTETRTIGGQLTHKLTEDVSVAFDVSRAVSVGFFDDESESTMAFVAVKKTFGANQ